MFKTMAVSMADLLEPEKAAEWDKRLNDLAETVNAAKCGFANASLLASDGIIVAAFDVKELEQVQVGPGAYAKMARVEIAPEEFAKRSAQYAEAKARGVAVAPAAGSGPRVLRP